MPKLKVLVYNILPPRSRKVMLRVRLQALVYHILPSTTAVFSYVTGSNKLSGNEQFFVDAQTVIRLLQTTEIKQGVSFIAANKVYTSTNKTTIVWIQTELIFFTRGRCASCLRACFGARLLLVILVPKLQELVYDILSSTTAVFSYAIESTKLSANEQFFVCAQTVVSLLQTTQIKGGVSFIAANKVYTSTNKTTIVWIQTELFFYPGWMRLMFTCVLWR